MAIKKSKSKVTSKVYKWDAMNSNPSNFVEFANTPEGKESPFFPMPDGRGVTFGRNLDADEIDGKGLPELGNEIALFDQFELNFEIRVSLDRERNAYLEIYQPGHPSYHKLRFNGIELDDAVIATARFKSGLARFLINFCISAHFESLYWQRASIEERKDSYDAIILSFENWFKSTLTPKRKREIGQREVVPGLIVTTYESIESGREPDSELQKEQDKNDFISKVFVALAEIETEGGKRTQLDVGTIIFENLDSNDVQSLMKYRCRKHGLKWRDILKEYDEIKV